MVYLFKAQDIFRVLRGRREALSAHIDAIDREHILGVDTEELVSYYKDLVKYDVPSIANAEISVDHEEITIPVRYGPSQKGTRIKAYIPFSGDSLIFSFDPVAGPITRPEAEIRPNELVIVFEGANLAHKALQTQITSTVGLIETHLQTLRNQILEDDKSLEGFVRKLIVERKARLESSKDVVSNLGFKLRRSEKTSKVIGTPLVRRELPLLRHAPEQPQLEPEPNLEMSEYDHILSVIFNMVVVMEKSPRAFKAMGEENFRDHILVQLNGHYEGGATGETFNANGKTDILIEYRGRNLFIAECKIWDGPEKFKDAIDQLLRYLTWRDTKAAIVVFNRSKMFSTVLGKIDNVVTGHSYFRRKLDCKLPSSLRFVLHRPDDANQEITITMLAFEVPS